jgi:hypothetical protein
MAALMSSQNTLINAANRLEHSNSDVITLVRRQVVYSEVVIPKDRLKHIQETYHNYDDDSDYYDLVNQLKTEMVTDDVMEYFGDQEETWIFFHGDVQNYTDDIISWINREWDELAYLKIS